MIVLMISMERHCFRVHFKKIILYFYDKNVVDIFSVFFNIVSYYCKLLFVHFLHIGHKICTFCTLGLNLVY